MLSYIPESVYVPLNLGTCVFDINRYECLFETFYPLFHEAEYLSRKGIPVHDFLLLYCHILFLFKLLPLSSETCATYVLKLVLNAGVFHSVILRCMFKFKKVLLYPHVL